MSTAIEFFTISDFIPSGKGFSGAVSDGRWIYFIPLMNQEVGFHGHLVRYDSTKEFDHAGSWQHVDMITFHPESRGFVNGMFDGQYLYFIPYHHDEHHGLVGRFNTVMDSLNEPEAWEFFDLREHFGPDCKGYVSGTFDGRYLYLSPYQLTWNQTHGNAIQYDTLGEFDAPSSWTHFDMSLVNPGCKGYHGAIATDEWICFVPYVRDQKEYHGLLSLYKRGESFDDPASWSTFDLESIHPHARGYIAGSAFGNGLFLSPYYNGSERHGLVAYCHEQKSVLDPSSWEFMDLTQLHEHTIGYFGAVEYAGENASQHVREVFFIPHCRDEEHYNGFIARFTAGLSGSSSNSTDSNSIQDPANWSFFDTEQVNPTSKGYIGATIVDHYLYLSPYETAPGQHSGQIARVDLRETEAWQTFQPNL